MQTYTIHDVVSIETEIKRSDAGLAWRVIKIETETGEVIEVIAFTPTKVNRFQAPEIQVK